MQYYLRKGKKFRYTYLSSNAFHGTTPLVYYHRFTTTRQTLMREPNSVLGRMFDIDSPLAPAAIDKVFVKLVGHFILLRGWERWDGYFRTNGVTFIPL